MIQIFNEDCMDLMARYPDGHFDLAIVDPPYGGGASRTAQSQGGCSASLRGPIQEIPASPDRFGGRFRKYQFGNFKKKNDSRNRRTIRKIRQGGAALPDRRNMGIKVRRGHQRLGRCPAAGILFGIVPGFKVPDYLGRELL